MGTHMTVLSESSLMKTIMIGFRWFSKIWMKVALSLKELGRILLNVLALSRIKRSPSYTAILLLQRHAFITFPDWRLGIRIIYLLGNDLSASPVHMIR